MTRSAADARQIAAQVGLAPVDVDRRAAAAADHLIHAGTVCRFVHVALDPVIEQVIVAGDDQPDVMLAKERHVQVANGDRRRLEMRGAAVRTRREHRMVKEGDDVAVAGPIEMIELTGHPRELRRDRSRYSSRS